jgi:hypothetical protein
VSLCSSGGRDEGPYVKTSWATQVGALCARLDPYVPVVEGEQEAAAMGVYLMGLHLMGLHLVGVVRLEAFQFGVFGEKSLRRRGSKVAAAKRILP